MKTIVALMLSAVVAGNAVAQQSASPQPGKSRNAGNALTEESLGRTLNAIGLKPEKADKRFDFAFKTSVRGEEWKFSMSAVLSRNGQSLWVMAWLDEIPKTSDKVPQLALLKLLAANDRMGNGKFFAYIPTNKRFVLQRVVPNEDIDPKTLTAVLQDLAISVADEYPNWSVAKWSPAAQPQPGGVPNPTNANRTQTSEAATKYTERRLQ